MKLQAGEPKYSGFYDCALLKLEKKLKLEFNIQPICLPYNTRKTTFEHLLLNHLTSACRTKCTIIAFRDFTGEVNRKTHIAKSFATINSLHQLINCFGSVFFCGSGSNFFLEPGSGSAEKPEPEKLFRRRIRRGPFGMN